MPKDKNQTDNEVDTYVFDETLKKIQELQQNLGKNIEEENDLSKKKEVVEFEEKIENENIEHKIDNSLLPMEELHSFNVDIQKNKKNSIGFYGNLILAIIIFLSLYALLNVSKSILISKYPAIEPSIVYFFEIIEILKFITLDIINFIKDLITIK